MSMTEHQKTRDFLLDKLQECQIAVALHSSVVIKKERRSIRAFNLGSDMIMACLLEYFNLFSTQDVSELDPYYV